MCSWAGVKLPPGKPDNNFWCRKNFLFDDLLDIQYSRGLNNYLLLQFQKKTGFWKSFLPRLR